MNAKWRGKSMEAMVQRLSICVLAVMGYMFAPWIAQAQDENGLVWEAKDSSGNTVAAITDDGDFLLRGEFSASLDAIAVEDDYTYWDVDSSDGMMIAAISVEDDSAGVLGDFYLIGTHTVSSTITLPDAPLFEVKNSSGDYVAVLDDEGNLITTGEVYENVEVFEKDYSEPVVTLACADEIYANFQTRLSMTVLTHWSVSVESIAWSVTAYPTDATVEFSDDSIASPEAIFDTVGSYTIQCVVSDGVNTSAKALSVIVLEKPTFVLCE